MTSQSELAEPGRSIIDAGSYMTLATADEGGRPWASPVWYARCAYDELLWVSEPEATHSRNIAVRPEVAVVIFDSTVPIGAGQGSVVYMAASAEQLAGAEVESGIKAFSDWSEAHGASRWAVEDVQPPASHRLYRARVSQHWLLGPKDRRIAVSLG